MAAGDLCTTGDVEQFLSLTAGQDNALLTALVTNASAFINNYCSRSILSAAYSEVRSGIGNDRFLLRNYPVTAVASVVIDDVTIPLSTKAAMSGYVWDDKVIYLRNYTFNRGFQNVVINYTAGFSAVPADLKQACVELVAVKYKRRTELHINSKVLDGQQINYAAGEIPPTVKIVLENYTRVI